jgi:hypothetical protein
MDVSRSEAQRAQTNVIARSVDRATTTSMIVAFPSTHCAEAHIETHRATTIKKTNGNNESFQSIVAVSHL